LIDTFFRLKDVHCSEDPEVDTMMPSLVSVAQVIQ